MCVLISLHASLYQAHHDTTDTSISNSVDIRYNAAKPHLRRAKSRNDLRIHMVQKSQTISKPLITSMWEQYYGISIYTSNLSLPTFTPDMRRESYHATYLKEMCPQRGCCMASHRDTPYPHCATEVKTWRCGPTQIK